MILARNPRLWSLVLIGLLPACTPDSAKELEFGRAIPDARYEVVLDQEYTVTELRPKLEQLASVAGFDSDKVGSDQQPTKPHYRIMRIPNRTWNPPRDTETLSYGIGIATPRGLDRTDRFEMIYYHINTEPFDAEDWVTFADWGNKYIPAIFPNALIRVTRHPASQTSPEEIERIIRETDLVVPDGDATSRLSTLESGSFPDKVLPDEIVAPIELSDGSLGFYFVWLDLPAGKSKVEPIDVKVSVRAVSPTMVEGPKVILDVQNP